jgi:hypothetical protein
MRYWTTLYLLLSILLIVGCAKDYRARLPIINEQDCKPSFLLPHQEGWFTTHIDVVGKNLSGLVFIKSMEDGSKRVVFTNEVGVTFFDFSYTASGVFQVKQILPALNKKVIINTLQKDFSLFLGIPFNANHLVSVSSNEADDHYYTFSWDKDQAHYITSDKCALQRLEYGSRKQKVVSISYPTHDEVVITHFTFQMRIYMKVLVK